MIEEVPRSMQLYYWIWMIRSYMKQGVEAIKGYTKDEIVGQNFNIFFCPQDRQEGLPQKLLQLATIEGRAGMWGDG